MIRPLYDNVLVEKEKVKHATESGIVLSSKEEETHYGKVVAMGDGTTSEGKKTIMPFKVGDTVLYKSYGGESYKENDKEYLVINAGEILAVIE